MAIVKQLLHRKNSNDSYDEIYLQTSADQVKLNDGTTVEATVQDLKTSVSNGKSAVASAITDKGVSTSATATFATMASNIRNISSEAYAYIVANYPSGATVTCTKGSKTYTSHDTAGIAVFGVDSAGDWTVTASDSSHTQSATVHITEKYQIKNEIIRFYPDWYTALKNKSVGQTVTIDSMVWLLVNKTSTTATLGLNIIYSETKFGSSSKYKGSTLASVAASFESNQLSAVTKQYLNDVTVPHDNTPYIEYDVTAKVFVPSYDQMNGGFSHYTTKDNRICQYQGSSSDYFTSSAKTSYVWKLNSNGTLLGSTGPTLDSGFRPHIEVNLTL